LFGGKSWQPYYHQIISPGDHGFGIPRRTKARGLRDRALCPANASLRGPQAAKSYSPAPGRPDDVHTPSPASWVAAEPPCRGIDRSAEQFLISVGRSGCAKVSWNGTLGQWVNSPSAIQRDHAHADWRNPSGPHPSLHHLRLGVRRGVCGYRRGPIGRRRPWNFNHVSVAHPAGNNGVLAPAGCSVVEDFPAGRKSVTRSHRRWHLWLWLLLAPVVLAGLVLSVVLRRGAQP
jgi:hypothetical protein